MSRTIWLLIALICAPVSTRAETVIKIATLAPRGSIWMRYFDKMKAEVAKATGGAVKIRYYPGQIQGAEGDVVRKMRTGQLHGGAFTSAGLALINPQVLVLQLPRLFSSYAQVDRVRDGLAPQLEKVFEKRGYVLLGWSELGWIHVFSKDPVSSLADLRKRRMWVQSDDPLAKAMMRELGLKPRPLAVPQVYPALNTGMVDAVYNSPLGCLALQWHSKLRYIVDEPLTLGIGATVISKGVFDKLAPDHRAKLKAISVKYHRALLKRTRRDNDKAKQALMSLGMKALPVPAEVTKAQDKAALRVARSFVPRYYPQAVLDKALSLR